MINDCDIMLQQYFVLIICFLWTKNIATTTMLLQMRFIITYNKIIISHWLRPLCTVITYHTSKPYIQLGFLEMQETSSQLRYIIRSKERRERLKLTSTE